MIIVDIYKNINSEICGFKVIGHAEYAKHGNDIVCSAVSAIVINTVNSIRKFTDDVLDCDIDENNYIYLNMPELKNSNRVSKEALVLLKSMLLGLEGIKKEFGSKYISIRYKEV